MFRARHPSCSLDRFDHLSSCGATAIGEIRSLLDLRLPGARALWCAAEPHLVAGWVAKDHLADPRWAVLAPGGLESAGSDRGHLGIEIIEEDRHGRVARAREEVQ